MRRGIAALFVTTVVGLAPTAAFGQGSEEAPRGSCNAGTMHAHETVPHLTEGNHQAHMSIPHCE